MDIRVGDVLTMKKSHPCIGMDFRLRCETCGHEMMIPRVRAEKNIRAVERTEGE